MKFNGYNIIFLLCQLKKRSDISYKIINII